MRPPLPAGLIAAYWRLTRGATLGAQGIVIGEEEQVLLVRHGYRDGWHFPGGGIEWRETAETAVVREVFEETGVVVEGRPCFHGLFANFATLPSDHIAVFVIREWRRPIVPPPSLEIRESRFFSRRELPDGVAPGTARRLAELYDGAAPTAVW